MLEWWWLCPRPEGGRELSDVFRADRQAGRLVGYLCFFGGRSGGILISCKARGRGGSFVATFFFAGRGLVFALRATKCLTFIFELFFCATYIICCSALMDPFFFIFFAKLLRSGPAWRVFCLCQVPVAVVA